MGIISGRVKRWGLPDGPTSKIYELLRASSVFSLNLMTVFKKIVLEMPRLKKSGRP